MGRIIDACRQPAPLTRGPAQHFFGYYDRCPWDAADRLVLAGGTDLSDERMPGPDDVLQLAAIDTAHDNRPTWFDQTTAWNWQQGCMLQWLGPDCDRQVVYNVRTDAGYRAIVRDLPTGHKRQLDRAVYLLSPSGRLATALSFERLNNLRPGYGYAGIDDPFADDAHPTRDGLWIVDVESGNAELVFSIDQARRLEPTDTMAGGRHWFNHTQFNPAGTRIVMLHRWENPDARGLTTRCVTLNPDGSDPHVLFREGYFSHYDWFDNDHLVAWCARPDGSGNGYTRFTDRADAGATEPLAHGAFEHDGHLTFSPDRRWMLTDYSYPDPQQLFLYRLADDARLDLAELPRTDPSQLALRCDLHPRFNRAGDRICIDATFEGRRQMYTLDVRDLVGGAHVPALR